MTTRLERSEPGATTDRSPPDPRGTWTIDPADSIVSFGWRTLRLWTITGRPHCLGAIHLDELPPVGVIRFQQPSGLPVLTMAFDPASLKPGAAERNAMLCEPDGGAVRRQRWWTLHSQSLEILPSGAWRVMATLTAHRTPGLVELRLDVDPKASGRDWLVLRGRGVLDRQAFATGKRASSFYLTIRLELTVHARRVENPPGGWPRPGNDTTVTGRSTSPAIQYARSCQAVSTSPSTAGAQGLSIMHTESPTSRLQASTAATNRARDRAAARVTERAE